MTAKQYFIGLDLGQANDFTALAALESQGDGSLVLRQLDRTRGRPYPSIVADVARLLTELDTSNYRPRLEILAGLTTRPPIAMLAVDATGVGAAVVDLLRQAAMPCRLVPITVTAGMVVTSDGADGYRVPKKDLVGAALTLLQTHQLVLSRDLSLIDTLVEEMDNFQVRITASGNETFGPWRERAHDDLVFAVALACWAAKNMVEPEPQPLVYNDWAPWRGDGERQESPVKSHLQAAADDLPELRRFIEGYD
jgi:hypothetical protein